MGILKSMAKGAINVGKAGAKAVDGMAVGAGKGIVGYGSSIIQNAAKNPRMTLGLVGGAAALGYGLADIEDRDDSMKVAGKAALGAAALSAIPGAAAAGSMLGAGILGAGASVGGFAYGLGRMSLQVPKEPLSFSNMEDIKFTPLGKGLVFGSALLEGGLRAVDKYEKGRMGTNDGLLRTATPTLPKVERTPSYANNGGATGDLVFSMYNNRQGVW